MAKKLSTAKTDEQKIVKGYKVFNPDFCCNPGNTKVQYEENKEFTFNGPIKICNTGFHFCLKAQDCFRYYGFDSNNIVCEVEARGEVQYHEDDSKACTNILYVGKRLTWSEVLEVCNSGKNNTGHSNTGDSNTGSRNTGDWNTGDRNTGSSNTGDSNTGSSNTGYSNTGDWNTGSRNTGDWNTGSRNTGSRNTGDSNTGDWNTGSRNTGYSNTGDWNTGSRNTGYSNTGDSNTGFFCVGEVNPKIFLFNKPSNWTITDVQDSKAFSLIRNYVDTKLWVNEANMTDEEKQNNKGYLRTGGFYRDIPFKEAFTNAWHNWSAANKKVFTSLPNFDAEIFEKITGVKI